MAPRQQQRTLPTVPKKSAIKSLASPRNNVKSVQTVEAKVAVAGHNTSAASTTSVTQYTSAPSKCTNCIQVGANSRTSPTPSTICPTNNPTTSALNFVFSIRASSNTQKNPTTE